MAKQAINTVVNPATENTENTVEVVEKVETVASEKTDYTFQEILDAWEKDTSKTFKLPEWLTQRVLTLRNGCVMIKTNQRFEFLHDVTGLILRKDWQEAK